MSHIKDENFYQVSGWMLNRLNLKGYELQVFAIIYGFTQDGKTKFSGSLSYLRDWLGVSEPTVIKTLKGLVEKGLLLKEEAFNNGVKFCRYSANLKAVDMARATPEETLEGGTKKTLDPLKKFKGGTKKTLVGGTKETLGNKDIRDIDRDKDRNISAGALKSPEGACSSNDSLTPWGTPAEAGKKPKVKRVTVEKPNDVSEQTWGDFKTLRTAKRAPITATALTRIRREAGKAGITLEDALSLCCTRGWQGFEADWIKSNGTGFQHEKLQKDRVYGL